MLKSYYQRWIKQRFKLEHTKQLKQNDILIFIYQYGLLYLVLIVLTFIAGINYGNNLILGFCFLISSILCLSFYLTFKQLHQLNIEFIFPEYGRVDQPIFVDLILKQPTKRQRFLYIEYLDQTQCILLTDTEQKIRLSYLPTLRGAFTFPAIKLSTCYPFGLVQAWTYFYPSTYLWIAPKALIFPQENKQLRHDFTPDVDEFRELRPFKEGDHYQAVSWKQLALGQGLFVKVFEQLNEQKHIDICYKDMPSQSHEDKLSLMMGLVDLCHQTQSVYRLHLPEYISDYASGDVQYKMAHQQLAQAK